MDDMVNWSDRRFQTLIHPTAAQASRKADEGKARGFPCGLDALTSHHNEAEYTDAVQTIPMRSGSCTTGGSPYTDVWAQSPPVILKRKKRLAKKGVHVWMQAISKIRYTLFLRSRCAFECDDRSRSASGRY
jgi:hypothetical protein